MHISSIICKSHGTNIPLSVSADSPPHHCLLPANATLNASIPRELHGGKWRWNQCHVYVNSSYSNDTETCPNGWHYDTDYTSTIVTEVSSSSRSISSNNSCSNGSGNNSCSNGSGNNSDSGMIIIIIISSSNSRCSFSVSISISSKRQPTVSDSVLERSNRRTGPVVVDVEDSCRSSRRGNSTNRSSDNSVFRNINRGSGWCNAIK